MLEDFHAQPARDRVIVALDCDAATALCLAVQLRGHAKWLKVGMTLYYAEGPKIVQTFKQLGFNVFLDLKFHDIPHQVEGAAASAVLSGADMLTMHAVGGSAMMAAGHRGAEAAAFERKVPVPATLAITVLTSMDAESLAATGVSRALPEQVSSLAVQARKAGLSGIVCSPQEASSMRELLGPDAFIVTPGVRPAGRTLSQRWRPQWLEIWCAISLLGAVTLRQRSVLPGVRGNHSRRAGEFFQPEVTKECMV